MTSMPRIILSAGPRSDQLDAIVIDVRTACFWRGDQSRPHYTAAHLATRRTTFLIFSALLASAPKLLAHEELYEFVWGEDPEGGPDNPRLAVATYIGRPSGIELMNWLGGSVVNNYGWGYFWEFGRPYQPKFRRKNWNAAAAPRVRKSPDAAELRRRYREVPHELARAS